ncbi:MAG: hypothetical protein QXP70_04800 [Methanomassiliicoccales archaeon]
MSEYYAPLLNGINSPSHIFLFMQMSAQYFPQNTNHEEGSV